MPITILDLDRGIEKVYYPAYNQHTKELNETETFDYNSIVKIYDQELSLDIATAICTKWWLETGTDCMIVLSDFENVSKKPENFYNWFPKEVTIPENPKMIVNVGIPEFGMDIAKARGIDKFCTMVYGRLAYLMGENYDYKIKSYSNLVSKQNMQYMIQTKDSDKLVSFYTMQHRKKLASIWD